MFRVYSLLIGYRVHLIAPQKPLLPLSGPAVASSLVAAGMVLQQTAGCYTATDDTKIQDFEKGKEWKWFNDWDHGNEVSSGRGL